MNIHNKIKALSTYSFLFKLSVIKILFLCLSTVSDAQSDPIHIDFDTSRSGVIIDTNLTSNIWQIGKPQKSYFSSALSMPNAIVTDTINTYSVNNYSTFYVAIPGVYWSGVDLRFFHKFETDTLIDGGKIEVSADRNIWTNLINGDYNLHFTSGYYTNQDEVSSMNDFGFSGKSNGWQLARCYWNYPQVDTLYLRFVFSSGPNQTNKDGWMIDSIHIFRDLGIGINEIKNRYPFSVYPNPTSDKIYFNIPKQFGNVESIDLFSSMGQQIKIKSLTSISLQALKNGLYFVVVTNSKGEKIIAQVIKE